ncbi:hypothetical protein BDZ89DRAFT_985499 [Hymenopellis radicata]|nr:hypothetical protein BDZ89DRAFT_985499 [Hymenopellis radicata]
MSDFDDELLELAEVGSKKRKSSKNKSSKKRKAEHVHCSFVSDYEEPESEEDEHDLYPLEGKYRDELDRQQILEMSELKREEVFAMREDQKQKVRDRNNVRNLLHQRNGGGGSGGGDDSVARAAKRQRSIGGEKSRKLDELKARRQAKGDKKKLDGSPRRDGSPMDTGSSEDEEDGQVDHHPRPNTDSEESASLADLNRCRVTRDMIVKHFLAPWFEDYITNAWVRYCIGLEGTENVYRICEVSSLSKDKVKPYRLDGIIADKGFELQHGKALKSFLMDKVSNANFSPKEYERFQSACKTDGVKLPTKQSVEAKIKKMNQLVTQVMTESDINALLTRKREIAEASGVKTPGWIMMERSRLKQRRVIAERRQDFKEVATIDAEIEDFNLKYGEEHKGGQGKKEVDMLAILSEKNRKSNLESVRRAEIAAAREKKMNRQNSTPDPSARLKIMPRTFNDATSSASASRAGTPKPASNSAVKTPTPVVRNSTSPAKTFEASIVDSIEVDLGDF